MIRFFFHILFFAAGVGAGIWWSVSNPNAAVDIAAREQLQAAQVQAAVSQARIDLLQKFLASPSDTSNTDTSDAGYQRMLDDEKKKLQDAKNKMN